MNKYPKKKNQDPENKSNEGCTRSLLQKALLKGIKASKSGRIGKLTFLDCQKTGRIKKRRFFGNEKKGRECRANTSLFGLRKLGVFLLGS